MGNATRTAEARPRKGKPSQTAPLRRLAGSVVLRGGGRSGARGAQGHGVLRDTGRSGVQGAQRHGALRGAESSGKWGAQGHRALRFMKPAVLWVPHGWTPLLSKAKLCACYCKACKHLPKEGRQREREREQDKPGVSAAALLLVTFPCVSSQERKWGQATPELGRGPTTKQHGWLWAGGLSWWKRHERALLPRRSQGN